MARLDPNTGRIVDEADTKPRGELVSVLSPSGSFEQLPADRAELAIRDYGFKPDTPELRKEIENEEKYGNRPLAAAGLGLARGLTFGGSDAVLGATGLAEPEALDQIEERNKSWSTTGELASFAVPMFGAIKALGTAGKVAKGLGAGIEAASAVGKGIEGAASIAGKSAARALGLDAAGTAAKVIGEYAPRALGIAGEAELYQMGHNLSQTILKDQDLTADALLANSDNALMLGGALGLGGPLAVRAGRAIVDRMAPELSKTIQASVSKATQAAMKKTSEFFDPDNSLQLFSGLKGNSPPRFAKDVSTLKEANFYRPGKVRFDKATGAFEQIEKGGLPDRATAAERLVQGKKDVGAAMGEVLDAGNGVKMPSEVQRFGLKDAKRMSQMLQDMRSNGVIMDPEADRLVSIVNHYKGLIDTKAGNLSELHKLRQGIDDTLKWENAKAMLAPEQKVRQELRRIINEKLAEGAGVLEGKGLVKKGQWQRLNKVYSAMLGIEKPLQKSMQQANAWVNVAGLRWRDLQLSAVGSPVGATIGGVVGGPVGAAIGSTIGGALGIANKVFQTEKGLLWRAHVGERLGALIQANKSMANVGARIAAATSHFVGAQVPKAIRETAAPIGERAYARFDDSREHDRELAAAKTRQGRFRVQIAKLSELAQDPEQTAARIADNLRGAEHLAPEIRDRVIQRQLAVYDFLYQKAPKDPLAAYGINPHASKWTPSDGEIDKWNRYVKAANNPLSILDDLKTGSVTPEAAETVKTLYPSLFREIQGDLSTKVAAMKETLPYQDRFNLGILFDVPTDPSLAPEFVESLLSRFDDQSASPSNVSENGTARSSGANKMNVKDEMTLSQTLQR